MVKTRGVKYRLSHLKQRKRPSRRDSFLHANIFQGSQADFYFSSFSKNPHPPSSNNNFMTTIIRVEKFNDTQTGMLLGIPRSARCVQRFDDSLKSAIHITYRISLRSSSMREPRDPLLKVVFLFFCVPDGHSYTLITEYMCKKIVPLCFRYIYWTKSHERT